MYLCIRIDKPSPIRIVIPAAEVIIARFFIVDITVFFEKWGGITGGMNISN